MELRKKLDNQLEKLNIDNIVTYFIEGSTAFENDAYNEPYHLLEKYSDNKSGDEKYDVILSYYIEILGKQEIELKLYFSEGKRYLHAIEFYEDSPKLFDFQKQLESKNINVYVCTYEEIDWDYGVIILDQTKAIQFRVNTSLNKYEIFQIEAPHVGEDKAERSASMIRGIQVSYKKISFQELKASRFWK